MIATRRAILACVCIPLGANLAGAASDRPLASAASPEDACNGGITKGAVDINGMSAAYLAGTGGEIDGDTLTVKHNAGFSVLSRCEKDWEPESIAQFKLLGRTMSFTVDLSRVGCACNLAFYLISSPARDRLGHPNPGTDRAGQPPYYCDANKVGGQWCPEVDIMEANNHAFQATLHSCGKPTNGHYEFCDRMGCAQNTRTQHGAYGPGSEFRIDTRLPFDVHTEFLEDQGVLTGMRTILKQAGKHVLLSHSNCAGTDLAKLSDAMKDGMSLRITYWGAEAQTMAWMDAPPCGPQSCSGKNAGDGVISNISVSEKLWQHFPAPKPEPAPWEQWGSGSQGGKSSSADQWGSSSASAASQWDSSSSGELAAPRKRDEDSAQYSSDWSQPWLCHDYTPEQQKVKNWCATAGFHEGYEYKYNGGHDSTCGFCWCCKRKAKVSWVEPSAAHTPKVISDGDVDVASGDDQLVWVVIDPTDVMFGRIVPTMITRDPTLFVSLHGRGVADWEQDGRVVKQLRTSEAKLLQKRKTAKVQLKEDDAATADCNEDSGSPCETSIKKESAYFNIFMQKYARGSLPNLAMHWWPMAFVIVFLALAALAAVSLVARRQSLRSSTRSSSSSCGGSVASTSSLAALPAGAMAGAAHESRGGMARQLTPSRGNSDNTAVAASSAVGVGGSSPIRRVHSGIIPSLPRAGSSCQRLLSLQEALA